MCGIVGFAGRRECVDVLIDQLSKLEYRGYDSAGVAIVDGRSLSVVKSVGKIRHLKEILDADPPAGCVGISHTRWATHGAPSTPNSHPHTDCSEEIAVVHNGIIENYVELRQVLQSNGHSFKSETDTEVVPHLIEECYEGDLLSAVRKAVARLAGSYALGIVSKRSPGVLIAARKDSPLVIGIGKGENYVASDIPALLGYTRDFIILEDGDLAVITAEKIDISTVEGRAISRPVFQVTWDASAAEKGGYEHFMLKEIHEQPAAVRDTLRGRLTSDDRILLDEMEFPDQQLCQFDRVYIVACGTAYHAGCVGQYFFEKLAGVPVKAELASEFRYREPILDQRALIVGISQSGETADTLAAVRLARSAGATAIALVNVIGSSLYREADSILYTRAGPEICVASTKAYVTQVVGLYLLGILLARARGVLSAEKEKEYARELRRLPDLVVGALRTEDQVMEISQRLSRWEHCYFLGRGLDFAVGLEGALKLKEISYIHAEAYAAGEMKHGPLALITKETPVICLVTQDHVRDKMLSNVKEIQARGGTAIGIVKTDDTESAQVLDHTIYIPAAGDMFMPPVAAVPLQLIAYHTSRCLNREIDQPRNLAKSVTVE